MASGSPSKQFPKPGRKGGQFFWAPQHRFYYFWRRVAMRRWTRYLVAIAALVVVTQLSFMGIATRKLEGSSSSSEEGPRIRLFEAFRHEVPRGLAHLRQKQQQQQQQQRKHSRIPDHHRQELADLASYERHHTKPEVQPVHELQIRLAELETDPPKDLSRLLPQPNATTPEEPVPQIQQQPNAVATASDPYPSDLIHIVHTRFMQHQGNLTTLGLARLKQFLAFCLPTMVHQTTQDFLWIVKVDPGLEDNPESQKLILEPLLEAVRNSSRVGHGDNIYVVASNYNFNLEGHGGSWRDGQEGEELLLPAQDQNSQTRFPTGAKVYTGDMARFQRAYDLREKLPVLETRLDADDGLNLKYIERVQATARNRFVAPDNSEEEEPKPKPEWLYWCILTQIEWHSELYSNTPNNGTNGPDHNLTLADGKTPDYWEIRNRDKKYYGDSRRGYVVPVANENFCITPGLTVGYGVGTRVEDIPRYPHTDVYPSLHDKFKFCHSPKNKPLGGKGPCLERMGKVKVANGKTSYAMHALRSRTLTSAGMDGVGNSDGNSTNVSVSSEATPATIPQGAKHTDPKDTPAADDPDEKKKEEDAKKMESILWRVLQEHFAIDLVQVRATQQFLTENRRAIALENSQGQCSLGHSCKDKARERLQKIVEGQAAATETTA